ncbi:hypothetical protein CEXT_611711 [Caerostris extrusa]|uniref:Uncharacterized protein n=1 Tax=Caerostris extrusa TaxID=172846 RepID=A0AAV4TRR5_CAEEX|nr:hypothetical protein CEXT_611711 [Caerostris extrusa]
MAMYSIVKQIGNRSTFQLKSRFSPARNYESRSVTSIIIHHGYLLTSRLQFVEAKWGARDGVLPNQRGRRKKINSKINTLVTTGIEKRGKILSLFCWVKADGLDSGHISTLLVKIPGEA